MGLPRRAACWAAAKAWLNAAESWRSDADIGVVVGEATARCVWRRNAFGVSRTEASSATLKLKAKAGKSGRILGAPALGSALYFASVVMRSPARNAFASAIMFTPVGE